MDVVDGGVRAGGEGKGGTAWEGRRGTGWTHLLIKYIIICSGKKELNFVRFSVFFCFPFFTYTVFSAAGGLMVY